MNRQLVHDLANVCLAATAEHGVEPGTAWLDTQAGEVVVVWRFGIDAAAGVPVVIYYPAESDGWPAWVVPLSLFVGGRFKGVLT